MDSSEERTGRKTSHNTMSSYESKMDDMSIVGTSPPLNRCPNAGATASSSHDTTSRRFVDAADAATSKLAVGGGGRGLPHSTTTSRTRARPKRVVAFEFESVRRSRLGTLYHCVTRELRARGWKVLRRMPASGRGVDCFLGGACASGIPYHLLSSARASPGARPVTNFFRGWEDLCRKSRCVQTLRDYVRGEGSGSGRGGAASGGGGLGADTVGTMGTLDTLGGERREWFRGAVPESFLFFPAQSELDETGLLAEAYGRHAEEGRRTWILKPSDGGKGKDIVIMDSLPDILHFLDDRPRTGRGSVPWVVQKYIENPLLLPGDRKFDIRCWVLVTRDYRTYLYREGVLRTTSVPYTGADDLSNQFVHLSNHCIQTSHPDYGKVLQSSA